MGGRCLQGLPTKCLSPPWACKISALLFILSEERCTKSLVLSYYEEFWPLKSQIFVSRALVRLPKFPLVSLSLGNINSYPILRIKNAPREINNGCRISSSFCAQNLLYRDFVPSRPGCCTDYPLPSDIYFSSGFPNFPQWEHWSTTN